jgi:hypothetical protein
LIQFFTRGWSDARAGIDGSADIDTCDIRAMLRKRDRDRAANATSRTGNDGNLALKGAGRFFMDCQGMRLS